MIPTKHTSEAVSGSANNCGYSAADGVRAREAKSGAFVTSVTLLLMHDMELTTMAQPRSEPCSVDGWCTIGPMP